MYIRLIIAVIIVAVFSACAAAGQAPQTTAVPPIAPAQTDGPAAAPDRPTQSIGTPVPGWENIPVMPGAYNGELEDLVYLYSVEEPVEKVEEFGSFVATLKLYFLGSLEIRSDNRQAPNPPTLKSQSLLAYLVVHRSQPQPRDRLAGLFFGERPERKARRCLSSALWHIRRCFPDEGILINDSHSVQFDPRSNFWLDL